MMTSCPAAIASMPCVVPRQDITTALSARPPSMISSQPIILRPCLAMIFSTLPVTWLWSPARLVMCSRSMTSRQCGQFFHASLEASSPPICIYSDGNSSASSLTTSSMKPYNALLPGHMSDVMTGLPSASMQASSGYASSTSLLCPGISNSGIISI